MRLLSDATAWMAASDNRGSLAQVTRRRATQLLGIKARLPNRSRQHPRLLPALPRDYISAARVPAACTPATRHHQTQPEGLLP